MTKAEAIKAEVKKFEVNSVYGFFGGKGEKFKVVAINGSFVTVINRIGEKIRRKVRIEDNAEAFYPYTSKRMYGTRVEDILSANAFVKKLESVDNKVEEIDPSEYAVSVDAQEVAIDAEIENANKAKAAEKVAKLQELKKDLNGKILVENDLYAENIIDRVLGRVEKNETKSENVGYDILENAEGDWVSILGENRWEINLASGETFNVWIDEIACVAESHSLSFLGFLLNGLIEQGNDDRAAVFTKAIEYKLKDKSEEDKNFWRKTLGLNPKEKLNTCFDDYVVDVDAAADVEIENEINNRLAEEKKRQDFIKSVLNMGELDSNKKIKLIPQKYYSYGNYLETL